MGIQSTNPNLPNFACAEYMAIAKDLQLMSHVIGGNRVMHANAHLYIKRWPREDPAIYKLRKVCAKFFDGTKVTLSSAVGMLFAKPVRVTWNKSEEAFKTIWPNIDAAGTAGEVFIKRRAALALRDGLAITLTDHPPQPQDEKGNPIVVHGGNEGDFNLRPKVALYARAQAIDWMFETINNATTLTKITLVEPKRERLGAFGSGIVTRYRVLRLVQNGTNYEGTWELFKHDESLGDVESAFIPDGKGTFQSKKGNVATFLPIEIAYAGETDAPMTASIPFLGVANMNIEHWEIRTDIRWYEKNCAYPQRKVKGKLLPDADGNEVTELPAGPGHALQVEVGGDVGWDELTGTSLIQLKESREDAKTQMGQMGSGFLTPDKRAAETAEAHRLDAIAEQGSLATSGQGIEDADNLMLEHFCWFMDIGKDDAPTVQINKDFEGKKMSPQEMDSYKGMGVAGILSRETIWTELETGERLPAGFDQDQEKERLAAEAPPVSLVPSTPPGAPTTPGAEIPPALAA